MKSSSKAALLSALVFPGAGHYSLKKTLHSTIIASTALLCLYIILSTLIEKAQTIAEKIQTGEIILDVEAISAELHSHAFSGDIQRINIALSVLIFVWLFSIFDSYRLGLKTDKEN
ncbi:MAG: hypothetical protein OCD00_09065 [Colwellia sp.]